MGEEKPEVNENKLSNQSDHSPVRQSEHETVEQLELSDEKKAVVAVNGGNHIPNGKGGKFKMRQKSNENFIF